MKQESPCSASKPERHYDLDWLRVLAVLLLLYFHTAAIFYAGDLGEFYVKNDQSSHAMSCFILFVHQWHMPLFFLLSGAGTWFALSFRSALQYVTERFKRLFIPFLFGTLVLVPPQVYYRLLSNPSYQDSYLQFYRLKFCVLLLLHKLYMDTFPQVLKCARGFDCKSMTGFSFESCPNKRYCGTLICSLYEYYYDFFNEKALNAIRLSQAESRRLDYNFVVKDLLLLGLIGEGTGVAATVLKSMGVSFKSARRKLVKAIGRNTSLCSRCYNNTSREIAFCADGDRLLRISHEEACFLGHNYIGTGHLLLGVIREREEIVCSVFDEFGVDPLSVRAQTITMLDGTLAEECGTCNAVERDVNGGQISAYLRICRIYDQLMSYIFFPPIL